jgi:hypothetical protein
LPPPSEPIVQEEPNENSVQTNLNLAANSYGLGIVEVLEILKTSSDGTGITEIMHFEDENKIVLIYNRKAEIEYLEGYEPNEPDNNIEELVMECYEEENPLADVPDVTSKSPPKKLPPGRDTSVVYECIQCHFSCDSEDKLNFHQKLCVENILPFQCGMCDDKFAEPKDLADHIRQHKANQSYVPCNTFTPNVRKRHPKDQPVITSKSIRISEPLVSPKIKPRIDSRIGTCERCNIDMLLGSLPLHMQVHRNSDNKKRMCEFCEDLFDNMDLLEQHYADFHVLDKYVCILCNKSFAGKGEHIEHLKTEHETDDIVGFTNNKDCSRAVQVSGAFYFECKLCFDIVMSKNAMQNHLVMHRSMAQSTKDLYCYVCKKGVEEKHFRNPCRKLPDEELMCEVCGLVTVAKEELFSHMAEHPHYKGTLEEPAEWLAE